MTMVNFRMPESQYSAVQAVARHRNLSFSQFMRYCIERACQEAAELERHAEQWKAALPDSVRGLIGIAEGASSDDDRTEREAYHRHLEEKYA